MNRIATIAFLFSASFLTSGCGAIASSMIESALGGSEKDRRAKSYERRGFTPERASRLAFEDEVWSDM